MGKLVKNPATMQETWVRFLGWEDPLEKEKATQSSILAWRIPWGLKESDTTEQLSLTHSTCHIQIDAGTVSDSMTSDHVTHGI